jgi:exosortase A-associated hydrolase 2
MLRHLPPTERDPTPCVLFVPPFAEEMNKCRRAMTETARCLAARGFATALVDVFGTGDSDGDFGEATWSRWIADVRRALERCAECGHSVRGLVGVRLGCALATAVASDLDEEVRTVVFWQPVLDGARALDQFLRLRTAASLMSGERETVKTLRERLCGGETLEVAGYSLSSRLALELDRVRLIELGGMVASRIEWIDVVSEPRPAAPQTSEALERLAARRPPNSVAYRQVQGEPFWASTEIVLLPELVERTVAALCDAS